MSQIRKKPLDSSQNIGARKYYALYSCAFALLAVVVFLPFTVNGLSFVFCDDSQGGDGLVQHFNAFCYYGTYLRDIITTLVFEHRLEIPLWDMSIGYGQDIITTLSYYVIGDPFSFLSVLFPRKYAELGYCLLILARMWCAGIAFSAYCRYRGERGLNVLVGALLYVFCFYALSSGVLHPYFLLPMIWLPLLLMGIEKIFDGKGPVHYIASMAIAGLSNFYFLYMLCILIALYSVLRYVERFGKQYGIRHFLAMVAKVVGASLVGLGMAAVLLIPSAINIAGSSRVSADSHVPLLYEPMHYAQFLPAFVDSGYGSYSYLGFTAVGFVFTILVAARARFNRDYRYLIIAFVVLLVFFFIPFFGSMFNGFGYVTNRWSWALAMLVAYIVVMGLKEQRAPSRVEWGALLVAVGATALIVLAFEELHSAKYWTAVIEVAALLVALAIYFRRGRPGLTVLGGVFVVLGVCINALFLYSPFADDYISNFTERGKAYSMLVNDSPAYALKGVEDAKTVRFDTAGIDTGQVKRNSQMQLNLNGIAYYFSSTNPMVSRFTHDMQLNYSMDQSYNNLNGRCVLQALAAVKYLVIPVEGDYRLPYGFDNKVAETDKFAVYSSELALPLGFSSDVLFSSDDFDALNVAQKERALTEGIVLDSESASRSPLDLLGEQPVPYSITSQGEISFEDGEIVVSDPSAQLQLSFADCSQCDLYVSLVGLRYESESEEDQPRSVAISLQADDSSTEIFYRTPFDNYYCARDSFVGNLGYSTIPRNNVIVTFSHEGTYTFDSLEIFAPTRDSLASDLERLSAEHLEDVTIAVNSVKGTFTASTPRALCVQIPYSKGWSATVDGKEAPIYLADGMFMGLLLDAGSHDVALSYRTPYLGLSAAVSLAAFAVFLVIWLLQIRRKRQPYNLHRDTYRRDNANRTARRGKHESR